MLDLATAFTSADLRAACLSMNVRRPLGLATPASSLSAPSESEPPSAVVSDSTARALEVLAAPEAIAVVDHVVHGHRRSTYVAVQGPDAALHRVRGDHHVVESFDAERASCELLVATGLDVPSARTMPRVLDVTLSAFDRMAELVAANDVARAAAALEGDGIHRTAAVAIAEAARRGSVHVLGLRSLGHRYVGCDLSWVAGRDRWLVPAPRRAADSGAAIASRNQTRFVRAQISTVSSAWLAAELEVVFG